MMTKYFCSLSFILCSFHLSAATLDVEIQGVTDGGVLHLAIYSSKEVFESDRGDKPGSQPGIEAGVVKKIGKALIKVLLKSLLVPMQLGYILMKMIMRSLILTF